MKKNVYDASDEQNVLYLKVSSVVYCAEFAPKENQ